jgi:hypothetical protein
VALKCPECGLFNPPGTSRCDCGFDFDHRSTEKVSSWRSALSHGGFAPALSVATIGFVVTSQLLSLLGPAAQSKVGVPVFAVMFGAIAALLSRRCRNANWVGAAGIFAGIAVGTAVDAGVGSVVGRPDRNLWPLEIAFVWAVVAVPVLLGVLVGKYSGDPRSMRHR